MPGIEIKRVYKATDTSHGASFLVDRLWPRGLKKEAMRGALCQGSRAKRCVASMVGHDPKKWQEFRRRYFAELDGKRESWQPILEALGRDNVVLLYSAQDTEHNNAAALRDYLLGKLKR